MEVMEALQLAFLVLLTLLALQAWSNSTKIELIHALNALQDMAYTIATGYVALSILLAGFYIRISAIKAGFVRALSWLTYTKYSVQALGRIELLGRLWGPETCQSTQGTPIDLIYPWPIWELCNYCNCKSITLITVNVLMPFMHVQSTVLRSHLHL